MEREGFRLIHVTTGEEGLQRLEARPPKAVLLDLNLPGMDGVEVCRHIRATSDIPVIMLTARDSEIDKVVGLEIGADDYVTKPFSPRELIARLKAVLRRSEEGPVKAKVIVAGGFEIDSGRREVRTPTGETVRPTAREFDLLWYLAEHKGLVLSRAQILEAVWGYDYFGENRTVDVHIRQLRRKLEGIPIETIWGVAAALELFPALLLVGLFTAGKKRAAWSGVLAAAMATFAGMVAVGWDDTVAFFRDVIPLSQQWYGTLGNYSLVSFGTALVAPWFGWVLTVIIGVPLLVMYLRDARSASEIWAAGLTLALLLTSWLNYLVVLLPVLVVTVAGMSWPRDRYRIVWLVGSLGFWGPIVIGAEIPSVLASFVPTYGLITLFWWTRRRRPVGERTVPAGEWGD
jgi:DNA-binding response OmpR family regulator